MKYVIIILIILAVLLAAALIWTAMKRKKDQIGRERASELRSDAATTAAAKKEQEARAREAEAEAERIRAQADKLEVHAQEERTAYDMTRAQQEEALREADRVDPDVDHRSPEYQPDLNGSPTHRADGTESPAWSASQQTGPANPVPPGPETIVPSEHDPERRDQV
jgi:hypothetical protein